jgi:hypothetical protein
MPDDTAAGTLAVCRPFLAYAGLARDRRVIEATVRKEASRCLGAVSNGTGGRFLTRFSLDVGTALAPPMTRNQRRPTCPDTKRSAAVCIWIG